uniref:5-oxoprolinase n=1 Tax=Phallusia mammillata TaxID=59560 RepID=A0A6F9DMA7_9ASCI|nr:5-oxoprolinase [Phallusia mammillata]
MVDVVSEKFQFAIDRGGTFTDIYAKCPGGKTRVMKLLSVDPQNYPDAPREGIRRILEQELGISMPASKPVDTSRIEYIRMGTTVATNALLERQGERMALCITQGFRDLLHIGNQQRPKIFDLKIEIPDVLYEEVVEVKERVVLHQDKCKLGLGEPNIKGSTNEKLHILEKLDETKLREDLQRVLSKGIKSLAVALMHSYTYSDHEVRVGEIAKSMGLTHVSLSSEVMPMVKIVPRGFTACVDAYLTPCIKQYLTTFQSGFDKGFKKVNVLFMQSDGGLTSLHSFNGSRAILSGPAGGVVGYAMTSYEDKQPVIGFDMGGTSTDVSRYAGEYEHVFETTTAGVTIQAPQLDINTVAAGGGSRLFFRSGMFSVGPQSAGAHPGPACYRKGGPLTVTDANLCLGRLLPEYFPKIFGPDENLPLDGSVTKEAFKTLTDEINSFMKGENPSHEVLSVEEVAMGFISVANESMCRPIRALTQAKGHDTSRHVLSCFGGAGGQHACAIARSLGMTKVYIHKYSGILSAYGMALADVVEDLQEACACSYAEENFTLIDAHIESLMKRCEDKLLSQGFTQKQIYLEPYLNLRYDRTDCALMCSPSGQGSRMGSKFGDFLASFDNRYKTEFGFTIPNRKIMVDDVRVRGVGRSHMIGNVSGSRSGKPPRVESVVDCYFDGGFKKTNVYLLSELSRDHELHGPAIIIDQNGTVLVEPNCMARITDKGDVIITIGSGQVRKVGVELDSIQLSIFSHRFMSIAEQMGRMLQRSSISTNIKERLDFSCALFGPDGGLVSNAPHIPVHLGAMQEAVQYQMKQLRGNIKEGDCILSNHPVAGGSHLPDLTVITPVFSPGDPNPIFFLANRGHHADIGGTTPGSMPPHSTSIQEEGAVFKSFKLVKGGILQEEALIEALNAPGKIPGSSGTRNLHDNLADLRAQVAANQKGIHLVNELISSYSLEVVQAYMAHIQHNAEVAVRDLLRDVARSSGVTDQGLVSLRGEDKMDEGSVIKLKVDINAKEGSAVFDFSGTSPMVFNNLNAPRAITLSAAIYCLRCMVGYDVPLNQGCLNPVKILIPKWSLLDPEENAAVVGGNVLTSQRVVDVIMKAFGTCAASQGCMNNVTFGDDDVGYYETVAGGAGAGPTWHGRSGVHSHMTNTRITDPEILERRYPVVLKRFELNPGTGGRGKYRGGDGVIREILFRKDLLLSVLCERRVFPPYGMNGGEPGALGSNLLLRHKGPIVNMGGKNSVAVRANDVFRLQTPGGGGFGSVATLSDRTSPEPKRRKVAQDEFVPRGSVFEYSQQQEAH